MDTMSAQEAAEKWKISLGRVYYLCRQKKIPGSEKIKNTWRIPCTAEKPPNQRKVRSNLSDESPVRPFLKWAGGKRQLLRELEHYYPFDDKIRKYAEPFVGGGAVLFDILRNYELEDVYISDINPELINTYRMIQSYVDDLIEELDVYSSEFLNLDKKEQNIYYMRKRDIFNEMKSSSESVNLLQKAALMIFLNKTCFNGLYRVNSKGLFNVPMGGYKNPTICDEPNLIAVSEKLRNVRIVCGDYKKSKEFIDQNTFVYFDPPYKPITNTAKFTAYTENMFTDDQQKELAEFVNELDMRGAKIILSNSDPASTDPEDILLERIYSRYNIEKIGVLRMINCKGQLRQGITELLISNFKGPEMETK